MLKFFRKIRQQLLSENRFTKYLVYAIGEIILVVIGILIAVGINTQYNKIQNEKKIEAILRQVQKELLIDIADAKRIFNVFIKKDSLARKIIDDKVTVEMFIENPRKFRITNNYVSFSNKKGGYKRIMANLEILPERFNGILVPLNTLYVEFQNDIDDYNSTIKNLTDDNSARGYLNNPKHIDFLLGKFPEEGASYFVNDPYFKNITALYINRFSSITNAVNKYRIESVRLYKKIDSLLGKDKTKLPELLHVLPEKETIKPYIGIYKRIGETFGRDYPDVSVSLEKELLLINQHKDGERKLYWDSGPYFFERRGLIYKLYRNTKGQRVIEMSNGQRNIILINKNDLNN